MKNENRQWVFGPATKKKGVISEYLPWLLIAVAILAIVMITVFLLKEKGFSLIDRIKDLFRIS